MNFSEFHVAFFILLIAKTAADFFLDFLNKRSVLANSSAVPEAFKATISPEKYKKSVEYTLTKIRFGNAEIAFEALKIAVFVTFLFPLLFNFFSEILRLENGISGWASIWREGDIFLGIVVLLSFLDKPFEFYSTFKIEAKFGFNKSSIPLWLSDSAKNVLLVFALGLPLIWIFLAFYHAFPSTWWIFAQIAFFAFQLILLVVYPILILPLFNKLSPLPNGELRERLEKLAKKAGFEAKKIEVIDGSKRSGHSNAYFTGFGKWRRIVLFDTLIAQLSPVEIEAVLAHEIGHSKRGHVTKRIVFAFFFGFLLLWFVNFFLAFPRFFEAFGFEFRENLMVVPALLLLSQIGGLVLFWISPLTNFFSRKHEYEADAFAKEILGSGTPLVSELLKLHNEHLRIQTPHKIYSAFHYSHPTLLERENALLGNDKIANSK